MNIIIKKKTISSLITKKLIIGIEKLPTNDDKDEYLNIKNVINQTKAKLIPRYILMQQSIPTYVATPFPPLNFNQIGKRCPKKANRQDN